MLLARLISRHCQLLCIVEAELSLMLVDAVIAYDMT